MKGVCFVDVEQVRVDQLPDPVIDHSQDALIRVELAGLCGSDLHPFFGREIGLDPGTVMGHEFVGEVIAVGDQVRHVQVGDRVCAPFTTNCGHCFFCDQGLTSRCMDGQLFGWRSGGRGLHGGQATRVRVPLADGTLMKVPDGISDEMALLLGDNLSTGFFAADMVGIDPSGVYVVIGCGTVGLMSILAARRLGAENVIAVDPNPSRRKIAESLGAVGFSDAASAQREVADRTEGRGADGVMELVGLPQAQRLAYDMLRPGGTMSVIGCHCTPHFAFAPSEAYDKNLTYRTGRCPARAYMSRLARRMIDDPIDLSWVITHRFHINDGEEAYRIFSRGEDGCIKAVIEFE